MPDHRYIDTATLTGTGSVTFGAGSEDPPPNKVEIVFPSSETQTIKVVRLCSHKCNTLSRF